MVSKRLCLGFFALVMWAAVSPNLADFPKRVADYMRVRKNAVSAVSSLKTTDSPAKLQEHQNDLAISIRAARSS